jgi:hypothetical protein
VGEPAPESKKPWRPFAAVAKGSSQVIAILDRSHGTAVRRLQKMTKSVHDRPSSNKSRSINRKKFNRSAFRVRQLERVINGRHGCVPDTDDVDVYLIQVAHCFRQMLVDRGSRVTVATLLKTFGFWCDDKAPRVCRQQVEQIARHVIEVGIFPTDDACGSAIRLTYAERTRYRATAIGSIDADRATRTLLAKERRKERNRLRITKKRRENGVMPRAAWLAINSLSKTEPWKAMGISRSTWERRRKKAASEVDAGVSPHLSLLIDGRRTCVTEFVTGSDDAPIIIPAQPNVPAGAPKSASGPGNATEDDGGYAVAAPPPDRSERGYGKIISSRSAT